jgi:hypothetical protein
LPSFNDFHEPSVNSCRNVQRMTHMRLAQRLVCIRVERLFFKGFFSRVASFQTISIDPKWQNIKYFAIWTTLDPPALYYSWKWQFSSKNVKNQKIKIDFRFCSCNNTFHDIKFHNHLMLKGIQATSDQFWEHCRYYLLNFLPILLFWIFFFSIYCRTTERQDKKNLQVQRTSPNCRNFFFKSQDFRLFRAGALSQLKFLNGLLFQYIVRKYIETTKHSKKF